jgi:hypothetical protein
MKNFVRWSGLVLVGFGAASDGEAQCTVPATCGSWSGPHGLDIDMVEISCDSTKPDEIGHVTLIPAGPHQGRLLVWTHFDDLASRALFPQCPPYQSHIVDPSTWNVVASVPFDLPLQDGPFCSGHAWITGLDGKPKFLVVGGLLYDGSDPDHSPGSRQTHWFDPLTVEWLDGPDELPPVDPSKPLVGSWYPSVLIYYDPVLGRFVAIAVGGALKSAPSSSSDLFTSFWTLELLTNAWTLHTPTGPDAPVWRPYVRSHFLCSTTPPYGGEILTAGHEVRSPGTLINPCGRIATAAVPQTTSFGEDPNDVQPLIEGWHYPTGVLLHTLKPGWTYDPAGWVNQYDLNRVIMTGGAPNPNFTEDAYAHTLGSTGGAWNPLASAPEGRIFSNATLLPDCTLLLVGGQSKGDASTFFNEYRETAALYDPATNVWSTLAKPDPVAPPPDDYPTPRGYHSVSILLPDASVARMGGQQDDIRFPAADSQDTVDHYRPPYLHKGARPEVGQVPSIIKYGQAFTVKVILGAEPPNPPNPPSYSPIVRFCLMGIGSVTHHFDYGQRYVELMWESLGGNKRRLLAPPVASMAPQGYYLLFGVDDMGRPSLGKFVQLTFP